LLQKLGLVGTQSIRILQRHDRMLEK